MRREIWFKPNNMPANGKGWATTIGFTALTIGIFIPAEIGWLPPNLAATIFLPAVAIYLGLFFRHRARSLDEWRRRSKGSVG